MSFTKQTRKQRRAQENKQRPVASASLLKDEKMTQDETKPTNQSDGKAASDKQSRWFSKVFMGSQTTSWCIVILTAILAAVAIYQFRTMNGQLQIMKGQLEQADKQFAATHRPWMGAVNQKINIGPDGTPITWTVEWKNFGSSPAFGAVWHSALIRCPKGFDWNNIRLLESALPTSVQLSNVFPGDSEIEVYNGVNHLGVAEYPFQIGENDRISNNAESVILIGKISYRDDIDKPHTTIFCRELRPTMNGIPNNLRSCQIPDHAD